jgi:hypothetical protein
MAVDKKMNTLYKNQGGAVHARMMKVDEQTAGIRLLIDAYIEAHSDAEIKGLCVGIAGGGRDAEQRFHDWIEVCARAEAPLWDPHVRGRVTERKKADADERKRRE